MDTRTTLKTFFETGDKPTQSQFEDLINSCTNITDDGGTLIYFVGKSGTYADNGTARPGNTIYNFLFNPLLTNIDLTGNTYIKSFVTSTIHDILDTLKFNYCTSLNSIFLDNNPTITNIDLTGCTTLKCFRSNSAGLSNITNLSDCTALEYWYSSGTNLSNIDLSNNTNLIFCDTDSSYALISLNVSNTNIKFLNSSSCGVMTSLNITGCTHLEKIYLGGNSSLNSPDFTDATALYELDCSSTGFTVCDLSNCLLLNNVNFDACTNLTSLTIGDNGLILLNCNNCALDLASIDSILALIDANDNSNGYLNLSGGTNTIPTGGATNSNYLSLLTKGWTVYINT